MAIYEEARHATGERITHAPDRSEQGRAVKEFGERIIREGPGLGPVKGLSWEGQMRMRTGKTNELNGEHDGQT